MRGPCTSASSRGRAVSGTSFLIWQGLTSSTSRTRRRGRSWARCTSSCACIRAPCRAPHALSSCAPACLIGEAPRRACATCSWRCTAARSGMRRTCLAPERRHGRHTSGRARRPGQSGRARRQPAAAAAAFTVTQLPRLVVAVVAVAAAAAVEEEAAAAAAATAATAAASQRRRQLGRSPQPSSSCSGRCGGAPPKRSPPSPPTTAPCSRGAPNTARHRRRRRRRSRRRRRRRRRPSVRHHAQGCRLPNRDVEASARAVPSACPRATRPRAT